MSGNSGYVIRTPKKWTTCGSEKESTQYILDKPRFISEYRELSTV